MAAKHICRQCPKATRDRCIAQSHTSPSSREMIKRAFEARTETEETWSTLQISCLRIQEEREAKAPCESALARRLRLARSGEEAGQLELEEAAATATAEPEPVGPKPRPVPVSITIESVETIQPKIREADRVDVKWSPPSVADKVPEWRKEPKFELYFFLTLEPIKHKIALPTRGEVTLGRPDPDIGFWPDIDLTYEGKDWLTISRRHAKIYGDGDRHYIEDLGSTNGTMVNTQFLQPGRKHRLHGGDRIVLGDYLFVYGYVPK